MQMKDKVTAFLDKQGFYAVLGLCFVIIAVTAIITMTGGNKKQNELAKTPEFTEQGELEANYGGQNQLLEETQENTAETKKSAAAAGLSLGRPVEGDVIVPFAKDQLIYSKTLKQWTTHEGVDMAAKTGDAVKAVLGGTVEKIEQDALLGHKVTVQHENGHKSVYANLDKELSVSQGQKVNQGQELGKVGKTAIGEFEEEDHLHFAYWIDEQPVDPVKYMTGVKVRVQEETQQQQ